MTLKGRLLWIILAWFPVLQYLDDLATNDSADFMAEWREYNKIFKQAFPKTKEEV
jgi:hypothetical protein